MLSNMMDAGMNVARLNLSHGDFEEHRRHMECLRRLRYDKKMPLALMLDTRGPEVRTGTLENKKPVQLRAGKRFVLTAEPVSGTAERVSVSYPALCQYVGAGDHILIDDGLLELAVTEVDGQDVVCKVIEGGELGERKGITVPGTDLHLPSLTELDRRDIVRGIKQGVDLIAASFVCKADDVRELRKLLAENGGEGIGILAKIESRAGVDNFDEILREADGIMVARGDLGVEMRMEEVPVLQKEFIRKCNAIGKPVITATQMLDSMMRNNRPTRAEVNDVANSVLDGTDALMLSGETASGKHPLEALRTMARIAEHVERRVDHRLNHVEPCPQGDSITNALSYACSSMADDLNAAAIIVPTRSGETARRVARFRPRCVQIATTDVFRVYHQMAVVWGVHSLYVQSSESTDALMREAVAAVVEAGFARKGDLVILSAGVPVGVSGGTNLIKAQVVGNEPWDYQDRRQDEGGAENG